MKGRNAVCKDAKKRVQSEKPWGWLSRGLRGTDFGSPAVDTVNRQIRGFASLLGSFALSFQSSKFNYIL
jgi:hypothetical protein